MSRSVTRSTGDRPNWFAAERPTRNLGAQAVAFLASRGVLISSTVLVAHVVGISDYGVFALAMVVYQAGLLLRDAGLGQALIVIGRGHPALAWPAFLAISAAGISLAAVMTALADPITGLLGLPASTQLRILAMAFGIGSLGVTSNAMLEQNLRFQARAVVDVVSYASLGVTTVLGLLAGWGVDALAAGYVAQGITQAGLAIALAPPWAAGLHVGAGPVKDLIRYASLLWLGAFLVYLASNLDNALVGRLGGAEPLGVYALAYTLGTTLSISPAQVLNRVALPYYARDAQDLYRLRTALTTILPLSAVSATVPSMVTIALAPELASAVFHRPSATAPLVILCVYGVARATMIGFGTAANGIGLARYATASSWANVMIMAVAVPVGFEAAGPSGVAVAILAAILVSSILLLVPLVRHTGASLIGLVPPFALAGAAGLAGLLLQDPGSLPVRLGLAAVGLALAGLIAWPRIRPFGDVGGLEAPAP